MDKITREQAMTVIAKAMDITGLKGELPPRSVERMLEPFMDAATVSSWAKDHIADSLQAGIVSGRDSTELAPKAFITRAEVAAMIQRLLKRSELI